LRIETNTFGSLLAGLRKMENLNTCFDSRKSDSLRKSKEKVFKNKMVTNPLKMKNLNAFRKKMKKTTKGQEETILMKRNSRNR